MKQKIVIRVQMEDDKKRCKAMKKAVGAAGVLSAAIEGADKNQIVVVGEGVDSIALVTSLRKLMGFAELVTVAAVEEKKPEPKKPEPNKSEVAMAQMMSVWPYHPATQQSYYYPPPDVACHQYTEAAGCYIM